MISDFDIRCMELAIAAARCWPDTYRGKAVGAVLVKNGEFVSLGTRRTFHDVMGCRDYAPHAEFVAIDNAPPYSGGGHTLYVTLEPCTLRAQHPTWYPFQPCVEYIIEARIKRVVIGCKEDHPFHGGGANRLRSAGIEVDFIDSVPIHEACLALTAHPIIPPGQEENLAQADKELRNA